MLKVSLPSVWGMPPLAGARRLLDERRVRRDAACAPAVSPKCVLARARRAARRETRVGRRLRAHGGDTKGRARLVVTAEHCSGVMQRRERKTRITPWARDG